MWITVNLGGLCDVITKGTTPTSVGYKFQDSGINFVKVESIGVNGTFIPAKFAKIGDDCHFALKRSQLKEGDILFSIAGALGRTAIVTEEVLPANTNQALAILRLKPGIEVNKKFLLYVLNSDSVKKQSDTNKGGVAQQNLSLSQLKNYEIALPPLTEQQRIVAKLDAAFAGIDRAIQITRSSEAAANNIFTKELSNIFKTQSNTWIKATIEEVCDIRSGGTISKKLEKQTGDIPYLKVADMNLAENSQEVVTSSRFVMRGEVSSKAIIKNGSVIFPKRGGAIATNKKRITATDIYADLNIMSVHPKAGLSPKLLYFYFLNVDMAKLGSGSSIPQINNYDIQPLEISFPSSDAEQELVVAKIDSLKNEVDKLSKTYADKQHELEWLKSAILAQELQPTECEAA